MLRRAAPPADDPAAVLVALNEHFRYLWEETGFVTALYGVYDAGRRSLRLACAGHCRPVLCRAGRAADVAVPAVMPLLIGPLPEVPVAEVQLSPGDRLMFYTDGIVERMNDAGDFYGADRFREALASLPPGSSPAPDAAPEAAADTVLRVVESVERFAAGREPADDQTLLLGVVK